MIEQRRIRPDELGEADGIELHDALVTGERLADALDDALVRTSPTFTDGVMAALADEPTPGTTGFLVPLRRRGFGGLRASVGQAWAAVRGDRPLLARVAALAYVLAVAVAGISLTGVATLGVGSAAGLFDPAPSPTIGPVTPSPTTAPEPTIVPIPSPDSQPPTIGPTPTPSETPDETDEPDDNGGNSGPGGGDDDDDNSGPGSSGGISGPGGGDDDDDNSGPGGGSRSRSSGSSSEG